MEHKSEHTFHIPVMGLAYTIDTPIKVARFGISSVISIIEDRLIEMMRKHYYPSIGQPYLPITRTDVDYRAKRITDYLNLVNRIVQNQMQKLKTEAFEKGAEIDQYFEMLPKESRLRQLYMDMRHCTDEQEKQNKQNYLRTQLVPGSIDVNIMTKADREARDAAGNPVPDGSDAVAAVRGYINSDLTNSAIVFSAGMNPRVYNYLEQFNAFDPDENFEFRKKVILKVSDYRSALIQGKFLAKKGIWVSEFRIESGLNCGGHAFATEGYLLGPILEDFKNKREELSATIFEIYSAAVKQKLGIDFPQAPEMKITAQGGIGTHEEDSLLQNYYQVSGTGWGTPFLLVPEATTVEPETLELLSAAKAKDVVLSNYSPLGVRFYYLKGTTADHEKQQWIAAGKPGSPCVEKYLAFNTEFTKEPICTASRRYQKLKLQHLKSLGLPEAEFEKQKAEVLAKECLCVGLSNAAALSYDEDFLKNRTAVNVCPGPNIANFSKVIPLKTMIDHIYGRVNILTNRKRPHMFITELRLYLNFLKEQLPQNLGDAIDNKRKSYFQSFIRNLNDAIAYYHNLQQDAVSNLNSFREGLQKVEGELRAIKAKYVLD